MNNFFRKKYLLKYEAGVPRRGNPTRCFIDKIDNENGAFRRSETHGNCCSGQVGEISPDFMFCKFLVDMAFDDEYEFPV